jgi:hypothetical protein
MQSNQRQRQRQAEPATIATSTRRSLARRAAHRSAGRIVGACVLLVVVALAVMLSGCGATTTKTYTDADFGFSFGYPDNWDIDAVKPADLPEGVSKSIGAFDPNGTTRDDLGLDFVSVDVYEIDPSAGLTIDTLKTEFESWLADAKGFYATMEIVEAIAPAKVGGVDGYKATYTFTDQGIELRTTEYVLLADTAMYDLYLEAGKDKWAGDQEIFNTFLTTFKPGK